MNNQLREIKQSKLLKEEAFMYAFSYDDKVNNETNFYEINFGGFEQHYDNYQCEVINAGHNGRISVANPFLYLVAEGLADNGNFLRKQLQNREIILATLPMQINGDHFTRFYGSSGVSFNVINCRVKKRIKLRFVRPDFEALVNGTDINVSGITRWFVMLKMTPIVN
jgi:hypothetical protein